MKNMKIGKKLLVTFGTIFIMLMAIVIVSITSLTNTRSNFDSFYLTGYTNTSKAMDMRRAIQASAKYIAYTVMEHDAAKATEYHQMMDTQMTQLKDGITYLEQNYQGDQSLVRSLKEKINALEDPINRVTELSINDQADEATELYFSEVYNGFSEANVFLEQIFSDMSGRAETSYTSASSTIKTTTAAMIGISVIAVVIMIGMALYLTRNLTTPIKELEKAAKDMSEGDLNAQLTYTSRDEYGMLADSMRLLITNVTSIIKDLNELLHQVSSGNFDVDSKAAGSYVGDFAPLLTSIRAITESLSDAMSQIHVSSEQVSSGSEQVSSGAQALSQGATEQASSVEELAATINEVSEQLKGTASYAQNASSLANTAGESMAVCNAQMDEMIHAMGEIDTSSSEISKIIKTIEDIAFQTNILALNAAVEAARAGEAGKGFAVVADEVRNLASKSAEASKNTATLIENSVAAVGKGTSLANATAATLLDVVQNAKEVAENVSKIANAANEQAIAIAQITQGIDQISSVVQTNSATAEESAASSEELSGQAQILKSLVGRFTLKNGQGSQMKSSYSYKPSSAGTEMTSYTSNSMDKY